MTLHSNQDSPFQDTWTRTCEECLRRSDFSALTALLEQQSEAALLADTTFYQARIALSKNDFESAARLFWKANREAKAQGRTALQQRSLIWEAYAESQWGNYARAQTLADSLEGVVSVDDPACADIFFVQGLIAAEQGSLPIAQSRMEQARNIAVSFQDDWMQARCCANLAVIYGSQGLLDHAAAMIRRVERLNADPRRPPNQQQLIQVRNTYVYNLRWRGQLERALQIAEPLPEPKDDGSRLFVGYLALTTAMVATDLGNFSHAETLWEQACTLLRDEVNDDQRTKAELFWERAWLCLRQGDIEKAYWNIRESLDLINDAMETECYHAYVVDAIIAIRRNDLGTIGLRLRQASERFRQAGHHVGLASVLMHIAAYYLRRKRLDPGREALAEALMLMWKHQMYGTYYWDPSTMAYLCREAIQQDIWGSQAGVLAARLSGCSETEVREKFKLEGGPEYMWGEFAASLAARRLADGYWQEFVPLLNDSRPHVRRRAAQVLHAAQHPEAQALLGRLLPDADPEIEPVDISSIATPSIQIFSFGQFRLLLNGRPLHLHKAGTPKALIIVGCLLLMGTKGMQSSELALLLWPEKSERDRAGVLQATISNLREEFRKALSADRSRKIITCINHRYRLELEEEEVWWDWREIRRLASQKKIDGHHQQKAEQLCQEPFMELISELPLPPPNSHRLTVTYWERTAATLRDIATDYQDQVDTWMEELRKRREEE